MKTEVDLDEIIRKMNLPYTPAPLQYFDAITGYREGRYALFYEVGGGKTLVSTLIAMLYDYKTLIPMPHILLAQWKRWLKKVNVPEEEIYIYYGPKRSIEKLKAAKWVLTSHAIFRQDIKKITEACKGEDVSLLFDEAQAIKSTRSKIFRAVKGFIGSDRPFVPMTATPTTKPEDTYSYMSLKTPDLYRNFRHWENLHTTGEDIWGGYLDYQNMDLLKENFALRAAKRDKKELFGYDDNMRPILEPAEYNLDPRHAKLYKTLVDEQLLLLPDGKKIDGTEAQRLRHMLQQIVWNFAAFSGNPEDKSAGFDLLETLCEQVDFMKPEKSKFIIWTYYRSTSEAIYAWMKEKYGDTGVIAYGGSNSQKAVDGIMFNDSIRWAVFNPMSVGAGLELQHVCWEMFFAEMTTSPVPMRQSLGRFDRPGQKVRPTARFGQALGTVQVSLFKDLLKNDDRATYVEGTRKSLRQDLLGE